MVGLSVAFRFPRLENASDLHSDAAVVGLQAMHFLRGEWSPLLWGSGYQTSVDSAVAAAFFAVTGPSPLALRMSTFLGFLALTLFAYGTLRRHVSERTAAVLVLPLVFTPTPVHTYVFSPPRQAALTLLFAALFAFDGANGARRRELRGCLGGALGGFACFADPYALLFLPPLAFVAVPAVLGGDRERRGARVAFAVLGFALGLLPFVSVSSRADATHGVFELTSRVVAHNWRLLVDECLPFLLSTKVFEPSPGGDWSPWRAPLWFKVIQFVGAAGFASAVFAGVWVALRRRVPQSLARLGWFGAITLPVTLAGFLFSVMPLDHFSARYLVAILLGAPFALAPLAAAYGARNVALLVLPYLVSAAVAGWRGYGSEAPGSEQSLEKGRDRDDEALFDELRRRHIRYGVADYWAAYRLTFLSREEVVVVPWHASQDRYAPYRERVANAPAAAYVYDPLESLESLRDREVLFQSGDTEYGSTFETLRVGRYTVFVLERVPNPRAVRRPVFARSPQ